MSVLAFAQWPWQNPLPTGNDLSSVYFIDASTGYSVGRFGTIIKTIDGGLYSVFFADFNTGYAVGRTIFKTTDGGSTWTDLA